MSLLDPFPTDQNRIIKDLEKRVLALEALVRTVTGAPVTKASGPLFLPNSSVPANPSGGVAIFGQDGQFTVLTSGGEVITPGAIPVGSAVDNPASQTATPLSPGATVLGSDYNKMGADVDAVWNTLVELLTVVRSGALPAPF